jgi:cell division protein FtsB
MLAALFNQMSSIEKTLLVTFFVVLFIGAIIGISRTADVKVRENELERLRAREEDLNREIADLRKRLLDTQKAILELELGSKK